MILTIEIISLGIALVLCIYASISDICFGIIRNKILAIAALYAFFANIVYYGLFAEDTAVDFLLNSTSVILIALLLFYTHIWAGGDCKLLCVLAMLLPARFYLIYDGQVFTLFFAILFAFFLGYLYLLGTFICRIVQRKILIDKINIRRSFFRFLRIYMLALIYISLFSLLYQEIIYKFLIINQLPMFLVNVCIAWNVGHIKILKKPILVIPLTIAEIALLIFFHRVPLTLTVSNLVFVSVVVLLRLAIVQQNCELIPTKDVQPGMILSTATTMLMSQSKVKGLPKISTEDLRSRLSAQEVQNIYRWEHSVMGMSTVTIVRKIPFAIFISLGFVVYLIVWSVMA